MKTSSIIKAMLLAFAANLVYVVFISSDYFLCEFEIPRIITEWSNLIVYVLFVLGVGAIGLILNELLKRRYFAQFENWQVYTIFLVASLGPGIAASDELTMGSPIFGYCQSLSK